MTYDPVAHGARCFECPLEGCKVVPPETRASAIIAAVGEAPGEQEEKLGRPFVGPSGNEFMKAARMAGLRRNDLHITNALLCRPPGNELKKLLAKISKWNKNEAKEAKAEGREASTMATPLACCKPRLDAELSRFKDFITLGGVGTRAVAGTQGSILGLRGGLMELDRNESEARKAYEQANPLVDFADEASREGVEADYLQWKKQNGYTIRVMPTVHPSFVLRQQRWAHVFRNDMAKAVRWFRGVAKWIPPKVTYNPDPETLRRFLANPDRIYTYDIETDGIECLTAHIRCIAIGDETDVVVIGFRRNSCPKSQSGVFVDFYGGRDAFLIEKILRAFFEDAAIVKAGHNAGYYDRLVLQNQMGIDPQNVLDTMLLHRNVESELPHSLAYVASIYTEAPSWKCYDPETEVLTQAGWVKFPELMKGMPVAQWDEGEISFVEPQAYVDQPYKGKVWVLKDQATDLVLTPDHGMIYRPAHNAKTCRPEHKSKLKRCMVQDLPKTGYLPHVGTLQNDTPVSERAVAFMKLIAAFQADGTWMFKNAKEKAEGTPSYLDFGFTKQRKIDRLKGILATLGLPHKVTQTGTVNPRTRIWVTTHPDVALLWTHLGPEKLFGSWVLAWPHELRRLFLDELPLWDGTKGEQHTNYNTSVEVNADWVQAVAVLSGQAARKLFHEGMWRVSLPKGKKRRREWSKLENLKREEIDYDGRVYCVSVPAGFLVVRRGSKVTIAQNTDREGNKLALGGESDEELHEYCANDVAITARVLSPLAEQVALRSQSAVWRMDQQMQRICGDMHTVGMYVDQPKRLKEEKKLLGVRHKLLNEIRDRLDLGAFNPGSVYQLRDVLFKGWGLESHIDATDLKEKDVMTGGGDRSTGDLILRTLLTLKTVPDDQREVIKLIRRYRKCLKVLGTYVVKLRPWNMGANLGWDDDDDWLDRETRKKYGEEKRGIVDPRTGRMHPGYNAHVAVTGRLSSSKPINAQNFPAGQRGMVVAAPGHVLVGADMDQLELRIAAALWRVQLYLTAFAESKDPHSMTAFAVFGDEFCRAAGLTAHQFQRPGKLVSGCYDPSGVFLKGASADATAMRNLSKAVQYASQYMATVETVHQLIQKTELPSVDPVTKKARNDGTTDLPYAKLPLRRVREMRENWLTGAREFEWGWEKEIDEYRQQGYLCEPVGGRRRDFLDGEDPNQIVNFKVQGGAAGLMNRAIVQLADAIPLHKWGPGTGINNQCHDSIVVECPADGAGVGKDGEMVVPKGSIPWKVARLMEECMNQTHPSLPGVLFSASADVGMSWKAVG